MHCPKCGGKIPFYDLKPNCKYCGVNIMYFTQNEGLARDAKRTELEAAAARMVIARVKANFIGGRLQIARIIALALAAAALLIPFCSVRYTAPFFDATFSVGLIGLISAAGDGLLLHLPAFLGSTLFARQTLAAAVPAAMLVLLAVLDLVLFAVWLLGFLNLTRSTKLLRNAAAVGAVLCLLSQAATVILRLTTPDSACASVQIGFGALASLTMYLLLFFLNRALLQKGAEPQYREHDPKRKEMLRKVRKGEVNLDDLPLPVYESEKEREERLRALEEALHAEEEGRET